MSILDWNPDWETGIPRIDQQHRELFRQVESLMNAIHDDRITSRIPRLLTYLSMYVDVHFNDEETEMQASDYPGLSAHRAIHDDMRTRVNALLLQFHEDPTVMTDSVIEFIVDWLVNHINGEDRRMARYLIKWASEHHLE